MKTDKGVDSQLTIARSDRHDSGIYRCIAENPYGRAELIIFLAVQERPDTPSALEVFEVGSRTVKLSWRRPFDGNSPVLSYLVQYQPLKYLQSHAALGIAGGDWSGPNIINVTLPSTSISRRFVHIQSMNRCIQLLLQAIFVYHSTLLMVDMVFIVIVVASLY